MITFNQIKSLLDQGILPCLIYQNGNIDYICGCNTEEEIFYTLTGITLCIENGQLSPIYNGGGDILK